MISLICAGQRVLQEISCMEMQTMSEAVLFDVAFEAWTHLGKVEAAASEVRMGAEDLDRQAALRRADVDHRLVPAPGKFRRDRRRGPVGFPGHPLRIIITAPHRRDFASRGRMEARARPFSAPTGRFWAAMGLPAKGAARRQHFDEMVRDGRCRSRTIGLTTRVGQPPVAGNVLASVKPE